MSKTQPKKAQLAGQSESQEVPPTAQKYQLEKYKNMSTLEYEKLISFFIPCKHEDYYKYSELIRKIFSDRGSFKHESHEEYDREEDRLVTNQKLIKVMTENRKFFPPKSYYDINSFAALCGEACMYNPNVATKIVVSYGLYFKTMDNLGTERHHEWMDRAEKGVDIGCFGLTELGHGSNVRGLKTTAHYDKQRQEFILNSPTEDSMKFWIGGAFQTSNTAAIFAQLYIGEEYYGPHAFLVQIRDRDNHLPLSGIVLGDCGKKAGLDGIDNGFIIFRNHRIPRVNLLNKFSDVLEDGTFVTDIPSIDKRFAMQIGALSTGRVLSSSGAQADMSQALKITLNYAVLRNQRKREEIEEEAPLIEHKLFQYKIFPYIAHNFAIMQGFKFVYTMWSDNQKTIMNPKNPILPEMHALISGLKAISTWTAFSGVQACREICGELGYQSASKIPIIMKNVDITQTWEGDNNILLQQTSKYLLDMYRDKMLGKERASSTCSWISADPVEGEVCWAQTEEEFSSEACLINIFEFKSNLLLQRTGQSLSSKLEELEAFDAWNETQVFHIQDLAKTFIHLFCLQMFKKELAEIRGSVNQDTRECLDLLYKLNAMVRIKEDIGLFFEAKFFDPKHARFLRNQLEICFEGLKRHVFRLSFGSLPFNAYVDSQLAPDDGELYKSIVNRLYSSENAFTMLEGVHENPKL